jgi:hypothetical protein
MVTQSVRDFVVWITNNKKYATASSRTQKTLLHGWDAGRRSAKDTLGEYTVADPAAVAGQRCLDMLSQDKANTVHVIASPVFKDMLRAYKEGQSVSEFTGMFQDAAGTIPVTRAGQPVGLCIGRPFEGGVSWHSMGYHRPVAKIYDEAECWWDPEDTSTLFQDRAGTIPVVNLGDPVQLCVDKTGNGNHFMPDEGAFYGCDEGRHYISLPLDPITGIAHNNHKKAQKKQEAILTEALFRVKPPIDDEVHPRQYLMDALYTLYDAGMLRRPGK